MAGGSLLRIGVSGLIAQQAALRTTGQNIANTDTPGYSRQRVQLGTQTPQISGTAYQGTGVRINGIQRVVDDYVVTQLRLDTAAFSELNTYSANMDQVDSLLADATTGIAPGIQAFFGALNAVSDDPTSIPVRQLVLSQAEGLTKRFETVQSRLEQINNTLNQQMDAIATEVSSLAEGIASLNKSIVFATGRAQDAPPNDLLDTRDELIRKLSELVSVNVVSKENAEVDVFIGTGQALVIGNRSNQLKAIPGETDPFRNDLAFVSNGNVQRVSQAIKGGQLGGILSFRDNVLDRTINSVGRLGLTVVDAVNKQHALGLDLNGLFGGSFFADINELESRRARIVADNDNLSGDKALLSVAILDTDQLTESDYILAFPGPGGERYVLSRVSDGEIIQKGVLTGVLPDIIVAEGFEITFESGAAEAGDRFLVQPTRYGARDIRVDIEKPVQIAISSAIRGESNIGNEGTATIASTKALDITAKSFDVPGELSPPLVIVFTSQTTYDVLDNTNPAKLIDLDPPLRNLRYTPGVRNEMLPSNLGQTAVTSDGLLAGRLPDAFVRTPEDTASNGYVNEILSIRTVDPISGVVTLQPDVNISAGESARNIATRLTSLTGVNASANTKVFLSDFSNDPDGILPFELSINGVQVNVPTDPDEPELLNPNYLADIISNNSALKNLGIIARSDGITLTLESKLGDDISVAIRGDELDQVTLSDVTGKTLLMQGAGGTTPAILAGNVDRSAGFNFDSNGPYRFSISVNGESTQQIALSGSQVLGRDVVAEIQRAIDASGVSNGDVVVSMDTLGQVLLTTKLTGAAATLDIIDVSPALVAAVGFAPGNAIGADVKNEAVVGGILNVVMEDGVSFMSNALSTSGNLFEGEPEVKSTLLGFQITLNGVAEAGDKFNVDFNLDGVSDNRNGLALTSLDTAKLIEGSSVSLLESYGRLVSFVGALTSQGQINAEASESLLQQSQLRRDSIAGVNLDEEAADLIRFELAYNASAQVISIARSIFDTLINTFR
ncbi:MAG: flagellar hook-associated protein FlgK [Pseudomonadales bacterium]|nr:flagellar hook-associated protein FlgK [Pseudomonadales bacterium]